MPTLRRQRRFIVQTIGFTMSAMAGELSKSLNWQAVFIAQHRARQGANRSIRIDGSDSYFVKR